MPQAVPSFEAGSAAAATGSPPQGPVHVSRKQGWWGEHGFPFSLKPLPVVTGILVALMAAGGIAFATSGSGTPSGSSSPSTTSQAVTAPPVTARPTTTTSASQPPDTSTPTPTSSGPSQSAIAQLKADVLAIMSVINTVMSDASGLGVNSTTPNYTQTRLDCMTLGDDLLKVGADTPDYYMPQSAMSQEQVLTSDGKAYVINCLSLTTAAAYSDITPRMLYNDMVTAQNDWSTFNSELPR